MKNYLKEKEEIDKCPFHPNVNITKELSYQKLEETLDKLYQDSKNRDEIRKKNTETKKAQEESKMAEIKFQPKINEHFDSEKLLGNTLIKEDKHVQNELKRFEAVRQEKKVNELVQKTGVINIKNKKVSEDLLKEDTPKNFNCNIEKKTFKDGFYNLFTPQTSTPQLLTQGSYKKGNNLII